MQERVRVEVLTEDPQEEANREAIRRSADLLARILDTAVVIPGTQIRIGVDPLIGLLPGIGDAIASLLGTAMLAMASQLQVPKIVMARMSFNIVLNGVIGAIPVVGDFFSIWFRSNARNAELLRRHSRSVRTRSTLVDWAFVLGVLIVTIGATIGAIAGVVWLIARLWELVN